MYKVQEIKEKLSQEQLEHYEEFKRKADPEFKHTESVLLRYMRLCNFDVETALRVKSKIEENYSSLSSKVVDTDITNEIRTKKFRFGGKDASGRQIIHYYYRLHDPKAQPVESTLKLYMILMDIMLDDWDVISNGCIMICWMDGSGWSNFDFYAQQKYVDLFKEFLPFSMNMLGRCFLVNSPWFVRIAMNIMRPFVPKEALDKYVLCNADQLGDYFSESELLPTDEFEQRFLTNQYSNWI